MASEKISRKIVLEIKYVNAEIKKNKKIKKLAWELGFGPDLGWELGFGTPLHDPLKNPFVPGCESNLRRSKLKSPSMTQYLFS